MLYKKLIPLLFLVACTSAFAQDKQSLSIDVKNTIQSEQLVGITWATVNKDSAALGSAGLANVEHAEKMRVHQKMHVGSVAKTVLAMGVLHLVSKQQLSLDTHVTSLLPQLTFNNPWRSTSPITVQHLLEHSAGLDDIRMWQLLNTEVTPHTPLQRAFHSNRVDLLKVRTEPGTQFSYSNMGYTLLGMIIEAVTEQRYEAYLDQHFLKPLAMTSSSFEFVTQQSDQMLAMGYHENNVPQPAVANNLRPAGQFTTTAPDMAKFIAFVLSDGVINGQAFISKQLMQRLFAPSNTDAFKAGLSIGHGLAFVNRDRYGVNGQCHPGTTFGFRAYICLYPSEGKGYFYAVNTDNETADYQQLNRHFIQSLNVTHHAVKQANQPPLNAETLSGLYQLAPNKMAQFSYVDMLFHFVWVTPHRDKLLVQSLQSEDIQLTHLHNHLFRAKDRAQASHVFYQKNTDQLYLSNGYKTFKRTSVLKFACYWLSLVCGLLSIGYLLFVSIVRVALKKRHQLNQIKWVTINLACFVIPSIAYANQHFLAFGDVTVASLSLALLTGLLPITLSFCLIKAFRSNKSSIYDITAMVMLLQFCIVLFSWGLLPAIFWQ